MAAGNPAGAALLAPAADRDRERLFRGRAKERRASKKQLESGYLGIVNNIHHRRFPLVDEERGVVWGNCVFDMDGTVSSIKLTNGEVADRPLATLQTAASGSAA